jgi:hypothetical protein
LWRRSIGVLVLTTAAVVPVSWASDVVFITVLVKKDCKTVETQPEPALANGWDLVIWIVENRCDQERKIRIEGFKNEAGQPQDPRLENGFNDKITAPGGKKVTLACAVKSPKVEGPFKFKYSITGDVYLDPQLIVRRPSSVPFLELPPSFFLE